VKDLTALLRLAENPRDASASLRVLTLLPGVGPATAQRLMDALAEANGDFMAWADLPSPTPAAKSAWGSLVPLMLDLTRPDTMDLTAQVHAAREVYTPLMERRYDNGNARSRDLEQIERLAARFDSRLALLADIALDPPSWTEDLAGPPVLDEDYLVLSTMHSAKGLEWDAVYVIHAADGNIPSDMATGSVEEIDEERRLFYVACTRAKDWLYVCFPLRYYTSPWNHTDAHGYAQITRFIADDARDGFRDELASPSTAATRAEDPAAVSIAGREALRERLRAMWA
jgi:DNA helicase-2/ATP-dependent DNA helicase PcrA